MYKYYILKNIILKNRKNYLVYIIKNVVIQHVFGSKHLIDCNMKASNEWFINKIVIPFKMCKSR